MRVLYYHIDSMYYLSLFETQIQTLRKPQAMSASSEALSDQDLETCTGSLSGDKDTEQMITT